MPSARAISRIAGLAVLAAATAAPVSAAAEPPRPAAGLDRYVSPAGADRNDGTSARTPFRTVQHALDLAKPGTRIHLAAGTYTEQLRTKTAGQAGAPITITGPESGHSPANRFKAVVQYPRGTVIGVDHSYYVLTGFTVYGQPAIAPAAFPAAGLFPADNFKDSVRGKTGDTKLVVIGNGMTASSVHDVTISGMLLSGAGGECVRVRNNAYANHVEYSVIQWCGLFPKEGTPYAYHNGEGVYVGTSPKSVGQPNYADDRTHANIVRSNEIYPHGSECFDVKENASGNVFERNTCAYNDEPGASGGSNVELRGNGNTVRDNTISASLGWNVKVQSDPAYRNVGNTVSGNRMSRAANGSISLS